MSVRTPEEILKKMDTPEGMQPDLPLLIQLHAELLVSLSKEEERVSRRNLMVAKISCAVAIIALIISLFRWI